MPNKRAAGQKLLPIPAIAAFEDAVNSGLRRIGVGNRSQFIRDAIIEKLATEGVRVPKHLAQPPGRTHYPEPKTAAAAALNESASSKPASAAASKAKKMIGNASYSISKRPRSRATGGPSAQTSEPSPGAD